MHEKSDLQLPAAEVAERATTARPRTCLQDVERVTEALWAALNREPSDPEIASALGISVDEYLEDVWRASEDGCEEFSADGETFSVDEAEPASSAEGDSWDFPGRRREIEKPPTQLRALRISPYGFAWSVYAPQIERAMIKLSTLHGRAPEDLEIAEELHISLAGYHEMLQYLADFDARTPCIERKQSEGNEEAGIRSGELANALFCCLRSELQHLLSDAIRGLPTNERLFITLRYSEFMSDKDIELVLDLDESSSSRVRVSAHLRLSASLAFRANFGLDSTRRRPPRSSTRPNDASCAHETANMDAEIPFVYVSGTQRGVLHRAMAEKYHRDQALWDRHVRTWFSLGQQGELVKMRHKDNSTLKFDV